LRSSSWRCSLAHLRSSFAEKSAALPLTAHSHSAAVGRNEAHPQGQECASCRRLGQPWGSLSRVPRLLTHLGSGPPYYTPTGRKLGQDASEHPPQIKRRHPDLAEHHGLRSIVGPVLNDQAGYNAPRTETTLRGFDASSAPAAVSRKREFLVAGQSIPQRQRPPPTT
jgi:hypothetical protein